MKEEKSLLRRDSLLLFWFVVIEVFVLFYTTLQDFDAKA